MVDDESGARTADPGAPPRFLAVFDALRARPPRRRHTLLARMERRVARRLPAEKHDGLQRGDVAEPPPVLDLSVDTPGDRARVLRMLVDQGGADLLWRLPEAEDPVEPLPPGGDGAGGDTETGGAPSAPRPGAEGAGAPPTAPSPGTEEAGHPDEDAPVTTEQLYDLLERLVDGRFARPGDQPEPPSRRKPPAPPRFTRLSSLLWLRRCEPATVQANVSGSEVAQERVALSSDSKTLVEVINELRRVRLVNAGERRKRLLGEAGQRAPDTGGGGAPAGAPSRWERSRLSFVVRWRWLAAAASRTSRWTTRVSDRVTFGKLDERLLTPLAFVVSLVVTATPFAVLGLVAQQVNELVGLLAGIGLTASYAVVAFFVLLPWWPYRWLNRHRYVSPEAGGDEAPPNHRVRGIHVLNQLNDRDAGVGRISADTRPPGVHRLAVNALLDDLHHAYGAAGRHGRKLRQRPVLLLEQERLDPVARYLVLLIEDERLRRGFPDPLLIVQVRCGSTPPLVRGGVDTDRYPSLPEGEGAAQRAPEVARWTRARHAAGRLGARRLVALDVGPLREGRFDDSWRPEPVWVPTAPVLAARWTAGAAACVALAVLLGTVVVPALHPCVQRGLAVPAGIDTRNGQCAGVSFGDFVFHERLEEVTGRIRDQNRAVDESGDPYVTVAYIAELEIADPADPSLSGAQGELLGLAFQQDQHNELVGKDGTPKIKILIGNAGEAWAHAEETAREIAARAGNTRLGMDRPIGAVGFGHSVAPNSEAIRIVGDAGIPMVGTTATYDDVARSGERRHNEFFFPVAPANSRIAEQAAHWARNGVPWTSDRGVGYGLEPARTAVAIASAGAAEDGGTHEQYGPHLAELFMTAFQEKGGSVWDGVRGLGPQEYADGTLLYGSGDLEEDTTFRDHLDRLCTEDPPDLLYFAGRSADFTAFHDYFRTAGGAACVGGDMTILGGDDIAKFVADEENRISQSLQHPVFYTPLAASGSWGDSEALAEEDSQGFYTAVDDLVDELYREDGDEEGEPVPRTELPSIAHAAVASDALLVVSRAMPHTGLTPEELGARGPLGFPGPGRQPFLRTQEDYEAKRDQLLGGIRDTRGLTGMSGYLEFDSSVDGHWFPQRLVQLVLVGPDSGGDRQHVIHRCGMSSADPPLPDPDCV
ncbi:ABC transporter substrate-binding protein [Nocardiopsis sp. NPDC101807]|uniref:ABC transporter substrate-binding protein n=1 Tax=Nocardiopsis sp. NPDC101807 TaxID=3364339 RepID=UPI00382EB42E